MIGHVDTSTRMVRGSYTPSVEVALVGILEGILDVAHLVVHRDEVLLVYPDRFF